MTYLKKLGFGALIWAAIFIAICILIAVNIETPFVTYPIAWLVSIVLAWYFSKLLKVNSLVDGLITGILFVLAAFVLDYFVTTKYTGMALFQSWDIWVGYGLVFLVPAIYGFLKKD